MAWVSAAVSRASSLAAFASSQSKKSRSTMSPYLMTSASPARNSRSGKRGERVGIGEHGGGLMKRADEVLAAGMVDAGLAADRRIHLREQRGWNLHERDAALVTGGREAGHVADHAAAQRNDAGIARKAVGDEHVEHARDVGERLVRSRRRAAPLPGSAAAPGLR